MKTLVRVAGASSHSLLWCSHRSAKGEVQNSTFKLTSARRFRDSTISGQQRQRRTMLTSSCGLLHSVRDSWLVDEGRLRHCHQSLSELVTMARTMPRVDAAPREPRCARACSADERWKTCWTPREQCVDKSIL